MSDKLDATISISADTSGVEAGIDKTKKSLKTLGGAAQQMAGQLDKSGKAAGAGFDVIGAGATKSAKEIERATRTSARELQRQIAELKAGGKATREYAEALASLRGADINALRPLLDQLDQARKKTDAATSSFSGFKAMAASAIAGLSVGAFVSEIAAITKETAKAAAEIERFSALSNTSAQEFQRLAAGANTVGISAEKMADIFKDVQDKVGDFVQTGGGGMADFFERVAPKVGVTAEQFRKLSGKDALQLYVSSLEKANLAHSDMVFFMEAIASDSSLLLPLLKNQGAAWEEVGAKAQAYGAIMDAGLLDSARRFKTETDNLTLANQGLKNELMSGLLPALSDLNSSLSDQEVQAGIRQTIKLVGDLASSVVDLGSEFMLGMQHANGFWDAIKKYGFSNPFKTPQEHLQSLGEEIEKERGRAEKFSLFWTDAQKVASEKRRKDLQQQIGYYQALQRLAEGRTAKTLESLGREGLDGYESALPKAALSPAYSKPTQKSASLKAEESAYKSLAKSIADLLAQQNLEISTGEKLTNAQKLRMKVEQEVAKSKQAGLLAQIDEIEAGEAWLKNQTDVNKALADMQRAREQSLKSVQDSVKKLVEEAEATAYAEMHNISLAEAVERLALARAENAYQQAIERQEAPATLDYLRQEIEARKQLVTATAQKDVKEANKKAAEQAAKDWERVSQTIGDTLADYIMGGGKDAATYLKRLFSTLVLQPVVQTMAGGVMGTGAAAASGAGAGMMDRLANSGGGLTNWSLWGEKASGFAYDASLKSLEYGMADTAKSFVTLGNSIQKVDGFLKEIPGMKGGLGSAFGYGQAIYSLTQGNYGSAIGTAIGTYILPGIGTMIGSTLGGLVDGMFGSNPHDHKGGVYSNATGNRNEVLKGLGLTSGPERSDFTSRGNQAVSTALGTTIDQLLGAYDTLAERATGAARDLSVYAGFATNPKDKGQNAYGYLRIFDAATQDLIYKATHRNSSDKLGSDPAQAFNAFTGEIAGVLVQQLKAADLSGWMRTIFDGMGETVTLESFSAAMQQIQAFDYQIDMLGKTMTMFVGISDSMKTSLLGGLGGIEGLTATAQGFYQSYYSEQERYEASLKQMRDVLASLNVSIDPAMGEQAKADFRAAVEGAFDAGNGELSTQLLAINQQFAALADYAQKAGAAVDSLSDVMRDLLGERKSLEAELLRAQGNEAGYLAAIRAISTDGYTEAERAAWDYNAALQSQIDALDAAAEAAQQATQSAYANLQAAVNREKTYWQGIASASQSAISSLSSTLNLLTSNAQALYGGVDSAQQWQAAQGMVYIENALAAVRGGADVAGFDGLTDAITAARGGINEGAYATAFERERDALVLAGQLSQLGELTDAQLTVEERALKAAQQQIERLDKTLDYWQQQIDGTNGLINVGMSVQQAIDALAATMANGFSSLAAAKAAAMQPYSVSDTPAQRQEKVEAQTGVKVSPSDSALVAAAKVLYQSINGGASTSEYNAAAAAVGGNIAQAVGWDGTREGAEELRKMYGFAVGTNYVPYDMTARIHEGEAIVPKAFNPWAGGTGISGNNAELLTELRALREQNARLEQRLAAIEGNTHKTAQVLVDVTDDGNAMVTQELETL